MRTYISVGVALLIAGALAGCSSSGTASVGKATLASGAIATKTQTVTAPPVTVTVTAKPKVAKATKQAAGAQANGTYAFGATVTYEGNKLTLGTPVRSYPSEYAMIDPEMSGAHYYKIPVTITNATSKSVSPSDMVLDATSGTTSVNGVYDDPIGDDPTADILPGRTVAWVEGYQARPGTHLTIEISDMASFTGDSVTYDGVMH